MRIIKKTPRGERVVPGERIMRMSQSVTSSRLKFSKQVHAFTEQGVAMLSSVLHSDRAIAVNIAIMRTFAQLRQHLAKHAELARDRKSTRLNSSH